MAEPLFNWLKDRSAGVLLHPTSLPGSYGVGSLDENAVAFLEFLAAAGFKSWQICPLGPTGYGDSPYQCFSAFAGNPYLIDVAALVRAKLLMPDAIRPLQMLSADRVEFGELYKLKWPILFQAHAEFVRGGRRNQPYGDFETFRRQQAAWLPDYARFSALKEHFQGKPWWEWPADVRTSSGSRKTPVPARARQPASRRSNSSNICFSANGPSCGPTRPSWASRSLAIPRSLRRSTVPMSGPTRSISNSIPRPRARSPSPACPPDYFSADGQLWGNPLYDWPAHAADGYAWWISRLQANFTLFDVVRIDHFRGFESYWSIPAGSATAKPGRWVPGPGLDLFRAVRAALPDAKLIAEDLGTLTPDVVALREATRSARHGRAAIRLRRRRG